MADEQTYAVFAHEPRPPQWAIVQRDSKTGRVELILWAMTTGLIDEATQESLMIKHPDILKAWRLEEIK